MAEHTVQIQRTYDVGRSTPSPPLEVLTSLPGVLGVESPEPLALEVTYYDTPSLALAAEGISLRRTVDGRDRGWTLELPSGAPTGQEVTAPLGADDEPVPAPLLPPVRVHVRLEPVVPAVHLRTERRAHRLIGADHAVLATLADDLVTARPLVRGLAGVGARARRGRRLRPARSGRGCPRRLRREATEPAVQARPGPRRPAADAGRGGHADQVRPGG